MLLEQDILNDNGSHAAGTEQLHGRDHEVSSDGNNALHTGAQVRLNAGRRTNCICP